MFGTILGICIVEAYLGYRYESEQAFSDSGNVDDFTSFVDKLGHQLIFNEILVSKFFAGIPMKGISLKR